MHQWECKLPLMGCEAASVHEHGEKRSASVRFTVKNDVAFVVDMRLCLYEHQSTISQNMPLRDLIYVSKELQARIGMNELYRTKLVKIPTPGFVVFYNGSKAYPARKVLKLSDAFEVSTNDPELELKVTVLNINPGKNDALLGKCRILREYMQFVEKVRNYVTKLSSLSEAVERAVDECIHGGILKDFLLRNRNEAIEMCIFEYNEEEALQYIRQDEREIGYHEGEAAGYSKGEAAGYSKGEACGRALGRQEAILNILDVYGAIPDSLRRRITAESDPEVLKRWIKTAARVGSVEEFERVFLKS